MSTETPESVEMATKPMDEHKWLENLLGEWRIESEMKMEPGGATFATHGTASVKSLGGLWAFSRNTDIMPDGSEVESYFSLGYDVSFKEYRGCVIMSASSHLWKYTGTLSADGKIMTLDCEGPSMVEDNKTALYRDVIELIDKDHRTYTSYAQGDEGEWLEFAKSDYFRV
jgi:hypothetical protein